jgi:HEAT repeat protein
MKIRWRKAVEVVGILGCVLLTLVAAFALLTSGVWYPGVTPGQSARILIEDRKFGGRALGMAHLWGDSVLAPLREVSKDFTLLDNRNSLRTAEVLARNGSPKGLEISLQLYKSESIYQKLVGAVGLAAHSKLPDEEFLQHGFIYDLLTNDKHIYAPDGQAGKFVDATPVELALVAAKYARNEHSVPPILALINKRNVPYSIHAKACDALAEIGDRSAIAVLESAMQADDFYALPEAFQALSKLGDERAVPLAISRISPEIENKNSGFLVQELEAATGKRFGSDKQKWQQWWEKNRMR